MYAVIRTGGKQYRVAEGDRLKIEKLEATPGGKIAFEVLLLAGEGEAKVGVPLVAGAAVEGEIARPGQAQEGHPLPEAERGLHPKKHGHRQPYTEVVITAVRA